MGNLGTTCKWPYVLETLAFKSCISVLVDVMPPMKGKLLCTFAIVASLLDYPITTGSRLQLPILFAEAMCKTIETDLTEMAANNSEIRQLVGRVNERSRHTNTERESSNGAESRSVRPSNDNGSRQDRDRFFATPDLSDGGHR